MHAPLLFIVHCLLVAASHIHRQPQSVTTKPQPHLPSTRGPSQKPLQGNLLSYMISYSPYTYHHHLSIGFSVGIFNQPSWRKFLLPIGYRLNLQLSQPFRLYLNIFVYPVISTSSLYSFPQLLSRLSPGTHLQILHFWYRRYSNHLCRGFCYSARRYW